MPVLRQPVVFGGERAPVGPSPRLGEHGEQVAADWLGLAAALADRSGDQSPSTGANITDP
jgi:hypothetical protein